MKSEVLDLSLPGNYECFKWLDYPISVQGAVGGFIGDDIETGAKKNCTGVLGYIRYKKWFYSFLLICKVVYYKKCFPKW